MQKLLVASVIGTVLMTGTAAPALTRRQAAADIESVARARQLDEDDRRQAVEALNMLVDNALPVDVAHRVVEASVNRSIEGEVISNIARSITAAPGPAARDGAATIAAEALAHNYTGRETLKLTDLYRTTVSSGAPAVLTTAVVRSGIKRGFSTNRVEAMTNSFAGEVRSGIAPETAAREAIRE